MEPVQLVSSEAHELPPAVSFLVATEASELSPVVSLLVDTVFFGTQTIVLMLLGLSLVAVPIAVVSDTEHCK